MNVQVQILDEFVFALAVAGVVGPFAQSNHELIAGLVHFLALRIPVQNNS